MFTILIFLLLKEQNGLWELAALCAGGDDKWAKSFLILLSVF
jgi:hypothetical protein